MKSRRSYGLERVPFNRTAKRLRADDNPKGLKELAVAQVFPYPGAGSQFEELWQTLATAAAEAAQAWWDDKGNCHSKVDKAIKAAGRDWRGRGGVWGHLATWRGVYSTHERRYSSLSDPTGRIAKETAYAIDGETPAEEAPPQDDPEDLTTTDASKAVAAAIGAAREVAKESAEHISHTAQDDGERLDPKDDGEKGYGVDGATRGLFTGTVMPTARTLIEAEARRQLPSGDRKLWAGIEAAGSVERYAAQGRKLEAVKRRVTEMVDRYRVIVRKLRQEDDETHLAKFAGWEAPRELRHAAAAGVYSPGRDVPIAAAVVRLPPIDVEALEQAAWVGAWEAGWSAANPPMGRITPRPMPPLVYGEGPEAMRESWDARREVSRWNASLRRYEGWGSMFTWEPVALVDALTV